MSSGSTDPAPLRQQSNGPGHGPRRMDAPASRCTCRRIWQRSLASRWMRGRVSRWLCCTARSRRRWPGTRAPVTCWWSEPTSRGSSTVGCSDLCRCRSPRWRCAWSPSFLRWISVSGQGWSPGSTGTIPLVAVAQIAAAEAMRGERPLQLVQARPDGLGEEGFDPAVAAAETTVRDGWPTVTLRTRVVARPAAPALLDAARNAELLVLGPGRPPHRMPRGSRWAGCSMTCSSTRTLPC